MNSSIVFRPSALDSCIISAHIAPGSHVVAPGRDVARSALFSVAIAPPASARARDTARTPRITMLFMRRFLRRGRHPLGGLNGPRDEGRPLSVFAGTVGCVDDGARRREANATRAMRPV